LAEKETIKMMSMKSVEVMTLVNNGTIATLVSSELGEPISEHKYRNTLEIWVIS